MFLVLTLQSEMVFTYAGGASPYTQPHNKRTR